MKPWGTPQFKTPGSERLFSRLTIRFPYFNQDSNHLTVSGENAIISSSSKESNDPGCQRLSEYQWVSCLLIFLFQILWIFD